jgi:hypothetical protein
LKSFSAIGIFFYDFTFSRSTNKQKVFAAGNSTIGMSVKTFNLPDYLK